jgi:hypothetical protein
MEKCQENGSATEKTFKKVELHPQCNIWSLYTYIQIKGMQWDIFELLMMKTDKN